MREALPALAHGKAVEGLPHSIGNLVGRGSAEPSVSRRVARVDVRLLRLARSVWSAPALWRFGAR